MEAEVWHITRFSEGRCRTLQTMHGDLLSAKWRILSLIQQDKCKDLTHWISGVEHIEDVFVRYADDKCELYGYANYMGYAIEYRAEAAMSVA